MNVDILETIDARELGVELAKARKKAGLTQEQAAQMLEVARTTITAIEKGDRKIKAGELIKLARAYGRQVSEFVRPRPKLPEFVGRVQFRGPFDRSDADDSAVSTYIGEFQQLCEDYLDLEQLVASGSTRRYPNEYVIPRGHIEKAAEALAIEERNRLGLGDGPIPMLRDILEQDVGLRVFFQPLPSRFSEIYYFSDEAGGCMSVNSNHPEDRRRWSMAHGYAHFLTNRYEPILLNEGKSQFQSDKESDRFADAFSLYFLAPETSIRRQLNQIRQQSETMSIADLFRLGDRYGLGIQALIRRLQDLRELPAGYWEQFQRRVPVREAQRQLGLGNLPTRDDLLPVRYRQLAFEALHSRTISESQFARYLRIGRAEARELVFLDQDDVSKVKHS